MNPFSKGMEITGEPLPELLTKWGIKGVIVESKYEQNVMQILLYMEKVHKQNPDRGFDMPRLKEIFYDFSSAKMAPAPTEKEQAQLTAQGLMHSPNLPRAEDGT